jgi:hypothetical protein
MNLWYSLEKLRFILDKINIVTIFNTVIDLLRYYTHGANRSFITL